VRIGDRAVVIFHHDEGWFAVADSCPHAGMPLGGGDLRGCVLTCPFHGYAYNIKTGANLDFPDMEPPVATYAVKIEGGDVMVDMSGPSNAAAMDG
jgi:3-phenylpropionate/trans-cinnamate dioxygenase ferredoxin subunit